MEKKRINVTTTYLPDLKEYISYLEKIWESKQLTNNGTYVLELEQKLKEYLGVKHLFLVTNGTIAIQLVIRAIEVPGEIITTPFSYVATTSSIVWEGCVPIFVDIDPQTLCIDPNLIETAITKNTVAILATHVYGIPCDVKAIEKIARKHNLRVIYDAAHTFAVKYDGRSLASYGDISTLSFHATKLFHMAEGGAIVTNDDLLAHKIKYLRNFGHRGQEDFWGLGINAKTSELHAAMGLCILPHLDEILHAREQICSWYDTLLIGTKLTRPVIPTHTIYNFIYYPVIFPSETSLLKVKEILNSNSIFPRRYFYPALTKLPYVTDQTAHISEDISTRVLCLPLDAELDFNSVSRIANLIKSNL